jgi:hypothetical protein
VGLEAACAPVATLFEILGPAVLWWVLAFIAGIAALAVVGARPQVAVVLSAFAALALGLSVDGLVDDAYIQFRYAVNVVAGHGPVFNPGERIEGASGGLWIWVLALGNLMTGLEVGVVGRILSLLAAGVGVVAASVTVAHIGGRRAGAAAAIAWAFLPTGALYAACGLETHAFLVALWLAVAGAIGAVPLGLGLAAGIAVAGLRPEGAILAALALPMWRSLGRPARHVVLATIAGGMFAAGLRTLFYGVALPNSAVVKGVTAAASLQDGLTYWGHSALETWPLLAIVPFALIKFKRTALFALPAIMLAAIVVARGGDWMPGSRYFGPMLIVLVISVATGVEGRLQRLVLACVLVWSAFQLAPILKPGVIPAGNLWRAMQWHKAQSKWWEALGTTLRSTTPSGTTLAIGPAGAMPYSSNLETFDLYGLCSDVVDAAGSAPGHRLWGLRQAVALKTDIIYSGKPVAQSTDQRTTIETSAAQFESYPGAVDLYQPILLRRVSENDKVLTVDVIWVRRESAESGGVFPGLEW